MPRINRKLAEGQIKSAKPRDKAYYIYDEAGLRLLVRPSGTKVWHVPYKLNDKSNVYTVGKYPQTGSSQARKLRDEIKALIKQGIDPNSFKKNKLSALRLDNLNTFEVIAREWYSKQTWAPKHAKNILSRLEKDVFSQIGSKPLKDVSIKDILSILKGIESRNALDVARRINQYCTAIFDYAITLGICESNPALGRSKFVKAVKRQNRAHLTADQLPDFIKKLHNHPGKDRVKHMVMILALTFVRPSELREARWIEFDNEKALWIIPASRTKMTRDHLVPLSNQVIEVLSELKELTNNSEFLFPSIIKRNQPVCDVALIKAVKHFTNNMGVPHGFRHTASTILNEQGFNRDHIEAQLAHILENKVRGTYNKAQYLDSRKVMMQWWADYLDDQLA